MRQATADILAVAAIALLLSGVNDANPQQYLCLGLAAAIGIASITLHRE